MVDALSQSVIDAAAVFMSRPTEYILVHIGGPSVGWHKKPSATVLGWRGAEIDALSGTALRSGMDLSSLLYPAWERDIAPPTEAGLWLWSGRAAVKWEDEDKSRAIGGHFTGAWKRLTTTQAVALVSGVMPWDAGRHG